MIRYLSAGLDLLLFGVNLLVYRCFGGLFFLFFAIFWMADGFQSLLHD